MLNVGRLYDEVKTSKNGRGEIPMCPIGQLKMKDNKSKRYILCDTNLCRIHILFKRGVLMELLEQKQLQDIKNIKIDLEIPVEERIKSYIVQIGNPYLFKYGNTIVQLQFSGKETLEDKLLNHIIKK